MGVQITLYGRIDEPGQPIGVLDARVELEVESRRVPQAESSADLAPHESGGAGQPRRHFLGGMTVAERHEQDLGRAHVRRHANGGDRDHADTRIFDLARDELRHHPLQLGLDALLSRLAGHDPARDQAIARATSTRE